MHIPRAINILALLGMILVLGLTLDSTPAITDNNRHTFTWISEVTPELASWAKNLSFTDVVVSDNSESGYLNLVSEGIAYWHFATSYSFDSIDTESLKQKLIGFVNESPNGHVYLDDTHYLLEKYGVDAVSNLFDAIREIQASNNCSKFILDGCFNSSTIKLYSEMNMTGIDFDAYQPVVDSYNSIVPQLELAHSRTIGIYVWAYSCAEGGLSWSTMTNQCLDSVYKQVNENQLTRLVVWNGYSSISEIIQGYDFLPMYEACLYFYPEWWEKVKAENMKFLGSNP